MCLEMYKGASPQLPQMQIPLWSLIAESRKLRVREGQQAVQGYTAAGPG